MHSTASPHVAPVTIIALCATAANEPRPELPEQCDTPHHATCRPGHAWSSPNPHPHLTYEPHSPSPALLRLNYPRLTDEPHSPSALLLRTCTPLSPHQPAQYEALYKRSIEDPAGFWAEIAEQFHWETKVGGGGAGQGVARGGEVAGQGNGRKKRGRLRVGAGR